MTRLDLNLDWRRLSIDARHDLGLDRQMLDSYVVRAFAPAGQTWPRLVLSLWYDDEKDVIYQAVGYKESQKAWWDNITRIPARLARDFSEMWAEVEIYALAEKEISKESD